MRSLLWSGTAGGKAVWKISEALWDSKVSPVAISGLHKKACVHIEDWRNRAFAGRAASMWTGSICVGVAVAAHDRVLRWMWLTIALSFGFYIPVVLWADAVLMIGMLMIPKACAYVWTLLIGCSAMKKENK